MLIEQTKLEKINLTKLSCKGLIPDEEFATQRNEYENSLVRLNQRLEEVKAGVDETKAIIEKIDYASQARINFQKASKKEKKEMLLQIGLNRELKEKKLLITPYNWLVASKEKIKPLEQEFTRFELDKLPLTKAKSERLNSLCCELRKERDSASPLVDFRRLGLATASRSRSQQIARHRSGVLILSFLFYQLNRLPHGSLFN